MRRPTNVGREPISPANNPDRFTADEAARWRAGECGYQTAYGMPWDSYCRDAGNRLNDFGYCDYHAQQVADEISACDDAALSRIEGSIYP